MNNINIYLLGYYSHAWSCEWNGQLGRVFRSCRKWNSGLWWRKMEWDQVQCNKVDNGVHSKRKKRRVYTRSRDFFHSRGATACPLHSQLFLEVLNSSKIHQNHFTFRKRLKKIFQRIADCKATQNKLNAKEALLAEKLRLMKTGTDDASCQATFEGIVRELQSIVEPPPLPIGFSLKGTFTSGGFLISVLS